MIPQFRSIVGQQGSITLLQRAIARKVFPNLVILAGHHGTGKTSTALISAMALTCENPVFGEPCLKCRSCKSILAANKAGGQTGNFMKVNMPEKINKSDFSELLQNIFILQTTTGNSVYVLEEIHAIKDKVLQTMLLEKIDSMPSNVYIIMTTTELASLIKPLQSRARIFQFYRLSKNDSKLLFDIYCKENNFTFSDRMRDLVIQSAKGTPRDIISLVDFLADDAVTYEELQNYLRVISVNDFINLFMSMTEVQPASSMLLLDELLRNHDSSIVVNHLKSFILDVIYAMEADIHGNFSKDQYNMIQTIFENVNILHLATAIEKLTFYSTENDIKFTFLKIRQIMQNKKTEQAFTNSQHTVAVQKKTAKSLASDKVAQQKIESNQTQTKKMDTQKFLDTLAVFGDDK